MYEKSKNWINEQIKDRNKSFLVDQKLWDEENKKHKINIASMYRTKYCGDCTNHAASDINHNSSGYTSCKITHNSVTFGMICTCNKWTIREDIL